MLPADDVGADDDEFHGAEASGFPRVGDGRIKVIRVISGLDPPGGKRTGLFSKNRSASAHVDQIQFGSAFVSAAGALIFSLSSLQVLRTSAVTREQFSICRKTRFASSR